MTGTIGKTANAIQDLNKLVNRRTYPFSIDRSLNLNGSRYLTKTYGVTGDPQKFTFSYWYRPTTTGVQDLHYSTRLVTSYAFIGMESGKVTAYESSGFYVGTTRTLTDTKSWYHIVIAIDTTQTISTNRIRIYINGVEETVMTSASYPSLNFNSLHFNTSTYTHYIGWNGTISTPGNAASYIADFYKIDGLQLGPESFAMNDRGAWVPKEYNGPFGTQGFNLPFSDATNTTTIATDRNAGTNNWTTSGITVPDDAAINSGPNNQRIRFDDVKFNYSIPYSCKFRDVSNVKFNRTNTKTGNRQKFTFAAWVKFVRPTSVSSYAGGNVIFGQDGTNTNLWLTGSNFGASERLGVYWEGAIVGYTNMSIRDYTAWYHLVWAVDTTNPTAAGRIRIYVNGVEATWNGSPSYPAQNSNASGIGVSGQTIVFGKNDTSYNFSGYQAECYYIDGQQLIPSSFGQFDSATGQFIPQRYTGTYGITGAYLTFADASSNTATTLGKDYSGLGNNFTPTNMATTDQTIDTPSNNFPIFSSLDYTPSRLLITDAGLASICSGGGVFFGTARTTVPLNAYGKTYWESVMPTTLTYAHHGIIKGSTILGTTGNSCIGETTYLNSVGYRGNDGDVYIGSSSIISGATPSTGDIIMHAFDSATGKYWIGRNGTWLNSGDPAAGTNPVTTVSVVATDTWYIAISESTSQTGNTFNFGAKTFSYTIPTGFTSLAISNITNPIITTPKEYFNVTTYTGKGAPYYIAKQSLQSDLVWTKRRDTTAQHIFVDSVRGSTKSWNCPASSAEETNADSISSFTTDGYYLGANASGTNTANALNASAGTYVVYEWKKGSTPGFDIVTYTGNATNRTINHSCGTAPGFIIVKNLSTAQGSQVYHAYANASPASGNMTLSATSTFTANATQWNSTAPTSSVFSVGTDSTGNGNTNSIIAYLWAEVSGLTKIGSFIGNGNADGPYIWCGFKPKFIILKNASQVGSWLMVDTARETYNVLTNSLFADTTAADNTGTVRLDCIASGFKIRDSNTLANGSSNIITFVAFAEIPFKYSTAR